MRTLAPRQTGTYVNLTVGGWPEVIAFDLKGDANIAMWKALQTLGKMPDEETAVVWAQTDDRHYAKRIQYHI